MTDQKVTIMELKVDLKCPCCYKKIKKILCKFPQIRDQKYDEKKNTVTITVVCCDPEKIRCKLCCMGGKIIINCIEIKPPPKDGSTQTDPPPPKSDGFTQTDPPPPKSDMSTQTDPNEKCKNKTPPATVRCSRPVCCGPCCQDHRRPTCCGTCSGCVRGGPCCEDHCGPTCGTCGTCSGCVRGGPCCEDHCRHTCGTCSGCVRGGPCRQDHCRPKCCGTCSGCVIGGPCSKGPIIPVPCYDNCGDGPCGFCGTRCGRVYYTGRCDYIWEENPSACSIM